mmetsp:Transcript_32522/g.100644  ORF Transcript_32522/g.100644 Transcript_32522/m.100644 type:complete len:218 (+) Transcript_32522:454-1107(+)
MCLHCNTPDGKYAVFGKGAEGDPRREPRAPVGALHRPGLFRVRDEQEQAEAVRRLQHREHREDHVVDGLGERARGEADQHVQAYGSEKHCHLRNAAGLVHGHHCPCDAKDERHHKLAQNEEAAVAAERAVQGLENAVVRDAVAVVGVQRVPVADGSEEARDDVRRGLGRRPFPLLHVKVCRGARDDVQHLRRVSARPSAGHVLGLQAVACDLHRDQH